MAIFTVKMRASQQGRHTSGAEKTVDESRLTKTVSALIRRAKEHELGQPDFINLKIEQQNPSQIVFLPALPVTDRRGNSIEEKHSALWKKNWKNSVFRSRNGKLNG